MIGCYRIDENNEREWGYYRYPKITALGLSADDFWMKKLCPRNLGLAMLCYLLEIMTKYVLLSPIELLFIRGLTDN